MRVNQKKLPHSFNLIEYESAWFLDTGKAKLELSCIF